MSLPMSRRDIAKYLDLSLETVSRAVTPLQREGVVTLVGNTQREIAILDRQSSGASICNAPKPTYAVSIVRRIDRDCVLPTSTGSSSARATAADEELGSTP